MRVLTLAMMVATFSCKSGSSEARTGTPEQLRAFDFLMKLDELDSAHVGAIGNLSMPARAFRLTLERSDANAAFVRLSNDAQRGGQLVALCGLKVTKSGQYAAALEAARSWGGEVGGMQGCLLGGTRPVAEVVHEIEAGALCDSYQGTNESPELRAHYRAEPFAPEPRGRSASD